MTSDTQVEMNLPQELKAKLDVAKNLLMQDEYEQSVETCVSLLEEAVAHYDGDDLHPALGLVWYIYGKALLGLSMSNAANLFGDAVKDADDSNLQQILEETSGAEGQEEEDEEQWEDDENDNDGADDSDENYGDGKQNQNDDYDDAWQALETSRLIYEKLVSGLRPNDDSPHLLQLADIYNALGDLGTEMENFEAALADYDKSYGIKKTLSQSNDSFLRELSELHFRKAIVCELKNDFKSAIAEMDQSKSILNSFINTKKASGEDVSEVESLLPELDEKLADLKSQSEQKGLNLSDNEPQPQTTIGFQSSSKTISAVNEVQSLDGLIKQKSVQFATTSMKIKRKDQDETLQEAGPSTVSSPKKSKQ
ncbi:hypothetical protein MP228_006876 [Amoeboaphelidium protococcarum]|nr:hypothetical protein MP228_006876 [Amoeboaphelidium protococcarum]